MENPLTEEQIEKLNEISKLPPEQQKIELPEFFKTLSKEQVEFLKKQQQGSGCIFCAIAEGKVPSRKVYQDETLVCVLDIRPANLGHTLVIPKKHYRTINEINDEQVGYIFRVVNKISNAMIESLNAEGTNIYAANGLAAGQNLDHIVIHVIPRYKDDNIQFGWEGKNVSDKDLDNVLKKLQGKVKFERIIKEREAPKLKVSKYSEERWP